MRTPPRKDSRKAGVEALVVGRVVNPRAAKDSQQIEEQVEHIEEYGERAVDRIVEGVLQAQRTIPIEDDVGTEKSRRRVLDDGHIPDLFAHAHSRHHRLAETYKDKSQERGKQIACPALKRPRIEDADERHDDRNAASGAECHDYHAGLVHGHCRSGNGAESDNHHRIAEE